QAGDDTVVQVAFWPGDLDAALTAIRQAARGARLDPAVGGSAMAGGLHVAVPAAASAGAVAEVGTGLRAGLRHGPSPAGLSGGGRRRRRGAGARGGGGGGGAGPGGGGRGGGGGAARRGPRRGQRGRGGGFRHRPARGPAPGAAPSRPGGGGRGGRPPGPAPPA